MASAESASALNPTLYSLLCRRFHGQVEIAHPGEAMRFRHVQEHILREGKTVKVWRMQVDDSGEEYHINCPFCGDQRRRLFINHRWGVRDEMTGSDNLWLMQCLNEGCQHSRDNQLDLHSQVFASGRQLQSDLKILPGRIVTEEEVVGELPGPHWRLDILQRKQPRHPAIAYLESRGLDPAYLGRKWNVGYCPQSRYSLATDRIIIPIEMRKKLVGWQARLIGDWEPGMPPKYWSMPGMRRRLLAYNFDLAVRHQTVVIVEGPADVWGFGPQSFGVIGKTLSLQMRRLLMQRLIAVQRRTNEPPVVVIMLDPTQDEKAKAKRQKHHIEKLYEQLMEPLRAHGMGLLKIYLPDGTDPGKLEKEFMRDLIREQARAAKLRVRFSKPA